MSNEYINDFANDEAWKDQDISVPLRSLLESCEATSTMHGIIDNLRERLAEAEGKFEHERFENSRLRGEVSRLLGIIEKLGGEVEGGGYDEVGSRD